jgi:hypothetical protein
MLPLKSNFINAVSGNKNCLFRESYETNEYTLWANLKCHWMLGLVLHKDTLSQDFSG